MNYSEELTCGGKITVTVDVYGLSVGDFLVTSKTMVQSALKPDGKRVVDLSNEVSLPFKVVAEPQNDPPVAQDASYTTPRNTPKDIVLVGSDPNGDPITYTIVGNPSNGTLGILDGNKITYTPNNNYVGQDEFTFKVNDGKLDSNIAKVTITIVYNEPKNDPPVAQDASYTTPRNTPKNIVLVGSDPNGDPITYSIVGNPSNGTLSILDGNKITYTPNHNYVGRDEFTFKVNDGKLDSNIAKVTITIEYDPPNDDSNDPPVAIDDHSSTDPDTPVDIPVLNNDSDPDGDTITIVSATDPSNGTVKVNDDGTITYTPDPGFVGQDTFNYTITDGRVGHQDTALVTVDIRGTIIIPPTGGPSGTNPTLPPVTGQITIPVIGAPQVDVTPQRVPAGDPTITVKPGFDAKAVYAVLPSGDKLNLKQIKPGIWQVSFMVPFETADGPYPIKVFAVNQQGKVSESLFTITIDNSLPVMKIKKIPQADGQYVLEIKPLFNAVELNYALESGDLIALKRKPNSSWWTAVVPAGSGNIIALDVSGYKVEQTLQLAKLPVIKNLALTPIAQKITEIVPVKNIAEQPTAVSGENTDNTWLVTLAALGLGSMLIISKRKLA